MTYSTPLPGRYNDGTIRMLWLKPAILFCTLCATTVYTDDQIAELRRRVELLSAKESAGPRAATLRMASALLRTAAPEASARYAEMAGTAAAPAPAADRGALERAIAAGDKAVIQQAGRAFLRAVEQGGENPSDYDWFALERSRHDIVAGGDNPSVRVRQALAELAELVRADYDFTLRSLDGRAVRLSALRERPVVVAFWATWCAPCQQEMPLLDKLAREGRTVLAITDEPAETVREFVSERRLSLTVLLDPARNSAAMFHVDAMPATVVLDGTGRVRARLNRTNVGELSQVLDRIGASPN